MNTQSKLCFLGSLLAGMLALHGSVKAQAPWEVKAVELEPLVLNAHAYVPHRQIFEACWKKFSNGDTSTAFSQLKGGMMGCFRYESTAHHFRSVVELASAKTLACLTHFDEPNDAPDLLMVISYAENLTPERVQQCLEYLPWGTPAGSPSPDYPLKPDGNDDLAIVSRDVWPFVYRMVFPYGRVDDSSGEHPLPKMAAPDKKDPPEQLPDPLSLPSTGFYAVAQTYARSEKGFAAAWKSHPAPVVDLEHFKKSTGVEYVFKEYGAQPVPLAYEAGEKHHRVLCFAYDNRHWLAIVQFKEPSKDDLAIFMSFPPEKPDRWIKQLGQVLEYLPYSLDTTRPRKGHPLTPEGKIDPAVFMRDFFSVLVSVY